MIGYLRQFLIETGFKSCTIELRSGTNQMEDRLNDTHRGEFDDRLIHSDSPFSKISEAQTFNDFALRWQWHTDQSHETEDDKCWQLCIPMIDEKGDNIGYVYLVRTLKGEKVLFQTASLLEAFSKHFPSKIVRMKFI